MKGYTCKIVAIEHLSLDGVYQGPARTDEDTRNKFKKGGWSVKTNTPELQKVIGKYMSDGWSLLTGRVTYEGLYEGWHVRQPASDMTKALTGVQKFVVSHDAELKIPWDNSTLLTGHIFEKIAKLKNEHDKTLIIFGSGVLTRALIQHGLVDELLLMTHPIILGEGCRLFSAEVPFTKLKLADEMTTDTGVVIATYHVNPQ